MSTYPNRPDRLWSLLDRSGDCWLWTGHRYGFGYGVMRVNYVQWSVHRLAWTLTYGPIPRGLCVCHSCDVPYCCNPAHLFLGTVAENNADRGRKGRGNAASGDRHGMRRHPERHRSRLHPDVSERGEANGRAKLSEEQVREIRRLYASGAVSQSALSARFGVAQSVVSAIVLGKIWKHVST